MDTVGALGSVVGIALIVLGLIGVVFPALPGPVLIWVGIAVWSASNGFVIGWPWLIGLLVLVVASWVSGHLVSATLSRRAGASWWGVVASIVGGLVGAIVGSLLIPTPVIGTILGGVAGAFLAVAAVEYRNTRSWRPALRASGAYLAGCLASKVVEGVIAATMLAVFVWRGFFA